VTENFAGLHTLFLPHLLSCSSRAAICETCCWFALADAVAKFALRMAMALPARHRSPLRLRSLLVSVIAGGIGAFVAWRLVPLVPKWRPIFCRWSEYGQQSFGGGARLHDGLSM